MFKTKYTWNYFVLFLLITIFVPEFLRKCLWKRLKRKDVWYVPSFREETFFFV